MQQRVTPKSLIVENKRRDYCRVRSHLKVILSDRSIQESVVKYLGQNITNELIMFDLFLFGLLWPLLFFKKFGHSS